MTSRWIWIAMLLPSLAACGTKSADTTTLMATGKQAADSHNTVGCIAAYTDVLAAHPEIVSAYVGRAGCYLDQGNAGASVQDYTEAIRLSPEDPDLYIQRAAAEVTAGNKTSAAKDYRKITDLSSTSGGQFVQAAEGLLGIGFSRDALFVVDQGLRANGSSWDLHRNRALIEIVLGNDQTALTEFQMAITLATGANRAQVLGNRANFLLNRQEYPRAIQDYTQAIMLDSSEYWFFRGRAEAHQAVSDFTNALKDFTSAIDLYRSLPNIDPDIATDLLLERGKLYLQLGSKGYALADLGEALKANRPSNTAQRAVIENLIAAAQRS